MASIDDLWQQVVENPDDIGLRLVLADALIEAGDPRGELIALQCRGADAKIFVGNDVPENPAEYVSELIARHWERWFGDAAAALLRHGSTFKNGMLALAQVSEGASGIAWERVAAHRELCAIERVRPFKVKPADYAAFLHGLPRDPPCVELAQPTVIGALRAKRDRWRVRTVRIGGYAWSATSARGTRSVLAREVDVLGELAPDVEVIEIPPSYNAGDELFAVALRLPKMFPKFRALRIEVARADYLGDAEPRLRALPFVQIVV